MYTSPSLQTDFWFIQTLPYAILPSSEYRQEWNHWSAGHKTSLSQCSAYLLLHHCSHTVLLPHPLVWTWFLSASTSHRLPQHGVRKKHGASWKILLHLNHTSESSCDVCDTSWYYQPSYVQSIAMININFESFDHHYVNKMNKYTVVKSTL